MHTAVPKRPFAIRRGVLATFALVLAILIVRVVRDDAARRTQLNVTNVSTIPIFVEYRGFYTPVRALVQPGQSWRTKYRDLDALFLQATNDGLTFTNQVHLFAPDPGEKPRVRSGELLLVREVHDNQSGKVTEIIPFPSPHEGGPAASVTNLVLFWNPR